MTLVTATHIRSEYDHAQKVVTRIVDNKAHTISLVYTLPRSYPNDPLELLHKIALLNNEDFKGLSIFQESI